MIWAVLVGLVLLAVGIECDQGAAAAVVCYVGSWAVYRPGRGSFTLEHIEPNLCTHVVYSFAGLNATSNTMRVLDAWQDLPDDYGKNGYGRVVQIRRAHPKIKILLAVGGWNEGSTNFSRIAADPSRRAQFVNNALQFIKKYDFDGLDLDWEFPTQNGGQPQDKENFVSLVKELYQVFKKYNLLLTAALSANPETITAAYDVPALSKYLDHMHLMCYDYYGNWGASTGPNAPLHSEDSLNIDYTIQHMLKLGAPSSKLILGVPFYGRTFELTNVGGTELKKFGSPSTPNSGIQGPFTGQKGFMGYNEICLELQTNSGEWEILWDETSQTPFAVNGNKFISYDNPKSIAEKVKLTQKYHMRGVMIWSVDTDDFQGDCSNQNLLTNAKGFPLLRTINIALAQPVEEEDSNEVPNEVATKPSPNQAALNGLNSWTICTGLLSIYFSQCVLLYLYQTFLLKL